MGYKSYIYKNKIKIKEYNFLKSKNIWIKLK